MKAVLSQPSLLKSHSYIGGEWVDAKSGKTFAITNPANGEHLIDVADLGAEETTNAVEAAEKAQKEWQGRTAKERATLLRRWNQLILDNQDDLATLMTLEQGKPFAEAKGEVAYGASFIDWFADEARRLNGDVIPTFAKDKRVLTIKQPIGVVAAITPWNFPSSMLARKLGPALAAGCTVVAKPATATPYSGLAWGKLCDEVGYPKGVVNILTGPHGDLAKTLGDHLDVDGVWCFGAADLSKQIEHGAAGNLKRTWVNNATARDWMSADGEGRTFLQAATEVKTIWVPFGE